MSARRLRVRVGIGALLLVAVVAICIHDGGSGFRIGSLVLALLGSVGLVEYVRMIPAVGSSLAGRAALFAGCAVLFWRTVSDLAGAHPPAGFFCVLFGLACSVPVLAAVGSRRSSTVVPEDARDLAMALLGLLLVVFPVLCLIEVGYFAPKGSFSAPSFPFFSAAPGAITENHHIGPWLLLVTIFTCKLNDIGGYLVGSVVGRTRLAQGISPNKSVEGAVAGLILGVIGAMAGFTWLGVLTPFRALVFGLLVSVASQAGDLCESLIKRSAGVKDSGAVIPAFGGILDLLDSFILAAPAGYTLIWSWI